MSGAFDITPKDGITATTLAASSEASDLIDNTTAEKLIRPEPADHLQRHGQAQAHARRDA